MDNITPTPVISSPTESSKVEIKMNVFKKIFLILFKPKTFFEYISWESSFWKTILYFLETFLFAFIIQVIIKLPTIFASWFLMGIIGITFIFGSIGSVVLLVIIIVLIASSIIHVSGKVFKSHGSFIKTFQAIVYSSAPSLIVNVLGLTNIVSKYMWLGVYNIKIDIFTIWSLVLLVYGFSKLHQISITKSILAIFIPLIIAIAVSISVIYYWSLSIYRQTKDILTTNLEPGIETLAISDPVETTTKNYDLNIPDGNPDVLSSQTYRMYNFWIKRKSYRVFHESLNRDLVDIERQNHTLLYNVMNFPNRIIKNEKQEIICTKNASYNNEPYTDDCIISIKTSDNGWKIYSLYVHYFWIENLKDQDEDYRLDAEESCSNKVSGECQKTDSTNPDTDGDLWFDGVEVALWSDPLDPQNKPNQY